MCVCEFNSVDSNSDTDSNLLKGEFLIIKLLKTNLHVTIIKERGS